ncbi:MULTISPECIES: ClpXP protease specificity-enhancing factor [Idiomarinaceae]|uniref:ClpXP protease specificity-enhancing factor n=1 Tax=Pseudidiomarina fusca TaxID=2965078 RepID=A0ABU3KWQ1_9GAMM|nr:MULTISPECIES: ClpXP protease specificity-enhancing factor [Idiomarinaceae]MDT7525925.1 ClpXP protease specificity-enhancing factor [Pseudidiomarina sp. GXY010]MRJ41991.1 ClpXP protease specificity-enhancing factor [Idiomarina sp. FeN1]NCU57274.1 ClpXP protease specificity-enhancing factor [Idiomarina sp. FenA--70]NCU59982.1 ClpXP protease specificity-enhancing factor [Idiomarina sp. FenBw--71]UUN12895.1 ClpXP protease specificity-enhancing factor [Idiomarina loihiensis]
MTPRRPYLVRAIYDWLLDNQLTPHLVVAATVPHCQLPWEFVEDGQIILNITPTAVGQFAISNEQISFHARFSGKPHHVVVPMAAVVALYARENGAGTMFEAEPAYEAWIAAELAAEEQAGDDDVEGDAISLASSEDSASSGKADSNADANAKNKAAKRSHLRVIK